MPEASTTAAPVEAPLTLNGLPVSEIRAELERVLKSRVFIHSHRIRRFLQFVVEECLSGQQHRLKEYLIGLEVFNRHQDFDPRVDSIVRVEARRLRTKIEDYYQAEGSENTIRIELRKGSYVPIFEHRRAGMNGAYPEPFGRRNLVYIGQISAADGDLALVPEIRRKLSHALLRGGQFQVSAECEEVAANGPGEAIPLPASSKPDYLLEGRLDRRGDDLQVELQLMHTGERAYVWSDSSEPDRVEDLASSLSRAMVTSISRPENVRIKTRCNQPPSFDYYLQGRYYWKLGTPEGFRSSIACFERAVEIDPEYAAAWASRAGAALVTSVFGYSDPHHCGQDTREATEKAISIEPSLAEGHLALGCVESLLDWNWNSGERNLQRAIQIDGHSSTAHLVYAIQLACRGLREAALAEAGCALELDPGSLISHFVSGWLESVLGRHDAAVAQHTLVARVAPDFLLSSLGLGWAHLGKGHVEEALANFTSAANLLRSSTLSAGCLGHCHGLLNQREEALRHLAQLSSPGLNQSWTRQAAAVSIAAIHAGLNEPEPALSALEQAAESRDCSLPIRLLNPEFNSLRGERRYLAILERMGLGHMGKGAAVG